jgi:hypothetical protein
MAPRATWSYGVGVKPPFVEEDPDGRLAILSLEVSGDG